jgi:hypothetical protein
MGLAKKFGRKNAGGVEKNHHDGHDAAEAWNRMDECGDDFAQRRYNG